MIDWRLSSAALVGREEELQQLVAAVSAAPALVIVEGESGVGKPRLITEMRGASTTPHVRARRL